MINRLLWRLKFGGKLKLTFDSKIFLFDDKSLVGDLLDDVRCSEAVSASSFFFKFQGVEHPWYSFCTLFRRSILTSLDQFQHKLHPVLKCCDFVASSLLFFVLQGNLDLETNRGQFML